MQRAIWAACTRRCEHSLDQGMRWIADFIVLKAVTISLEFDNFFVKRCWFMVHHRAVHDDTVVGLFDPQWSIFGCVRAKLL